MSLGVAVLCSLFAPAGAKAQTNTAPARVTNRYLLIVETSSVMQNRADGAFRVVADLFTSGMGGQLQRGDTIGLWTFNNELHAGKYPLQGWSPSARTNMAMNALNFLRAQKFEKKPRFDKVTPGLQQVVHGSQYITVIVISSGEAPLKGTPFDAQVNEFYNTWRSQQKSSRMPFIAVLRGQKGQFADCALHWAPWPVDLPPLPAELLAARVVKPVTPERKSAPASLPALTFTGHKPATEPASPYGRILWISNAAPAGATSDSEAPTGTSNTAGSRPVVLAVQGQPPSITTQVEKAAVSESRTEAPRTQTQQFAVNVPSTKPLSNAPSAVNIATNSVVSSMGASIPTGSAEAAGSSSSVRAASERPATPPVGSTSVSVLPSGSLVNGKLLWLAAGLCLVLAALIFWRWREQSRPPLHVSLITRSLERDQD